MGSEKANDVVDQTSSLPVELLHARARRNLSASAAARDGITTMIDTLRISKPPRAPLKTGSLSTRARRRALIPLAEGREELEARICSLEDALAVKDHEIIKLKQKMGAGLVKRRKMHSERDTYAKQYAYLLGNAKECQSALSSARSGLEVLVEDVETPAIAIRRLVSESSSKFEKSVASIYSLLDDITSALDIARGKLESCPAEFNFDIAVHPSATISGVKARPARRSRPSSIVGSDDDARSWLSYGSSTFGDDKESALETLIELVEILDAKVSASASRPGRQTVSRARRTITSAKSETTAILAERDRLKEELDVVMTAKKRAGGADAALASAAKTESELRDTRRQLEETRAHLLRMEKIAERVVRVDEVLARNEELESELHTAKKTVARLVQQRNSLAKVAPQTPSHSRTSVTAAGNGGASETMKRILDWRKHATDQSERTPKPLFDSDNDLSSSNLGRALTAERSGLPDRSTEQLRRSPLKKRRTAPFDVESFNRSDNHSAADSNDIAANDSASAQSLPVRGFLKRHDSFLSVGGISASGDEITIMNRRRFFDRPEDGGGLLMLLRSNAKSEKSGSE